MDLLRKLFGERRHDAKTVEVMIGICVHDPDVLVEPPSKVSETAALVLSRLADGSTLAANAKTAFIMTHGSASLAESERQAQLDLPVQMKTFMEKNGLRPDAYATRTFVEELRSDIKIIWMMAGRKSG